MATIGGSTSADQRDEGNTSALVRRLVRTTLTKKGAVRVDEQDVDRVFRYALRVVGSSLHASVEPDENAVADAVRLRLSRQGKPGSSAGVEFAELHSRLAQQPGLTQRWALLHTLLRVAETGSSESKRGGGTERGPDAAAAAMLANPMSASSLAGGLPALTPRTPTQAARARSANAVSVVDAADSIDTARGLAAGDGSTLGVEHPSARQLAHKELAAESLANLETAEQALVRDVLFACQGIDGVFIKYSGTQDAFVLNEDTYCSPGQRRLTEQLSECGWLFKRIRASLSDAGELNGDESSIDESPEGTLQLDTRGSDQGSTRQAFRAAIRAELAEYYRLIAVLEAQAQVPMASALAAAAANEFEFEFEFVLVELPEFAPAKRVARRASTALETTGRFGGCHATQKRRSVTSGVARTWQARRPGGGVCRGAVVNASERACFELHEAMGIDRRTGRPERRVFHPARPDGSGGQLVATRVRSGPRNAASFYRFRVGARRATSGEEHKLFAKTVRG